MKTLYKTFIASLACLFISIQGAQAHVSFVADNAYAGKSYIATATIPHGCEDLVGNKYDTLKIEISIPPEFTGVRPADSAFGRASVEKDIDGNVTKLIWTKSAPELIEDSNFIQVSFRGTLPNAPLTTLELETTQTCAGATTKTWSGLDAPKLNILPARAPGWNKYTAQSPIDAAMLNTFFKDAAIVWYGSAAYSANPVTNGLISNKLTDIPLGADFWVKY
jgi:periplasmic copper chaperone A